MSMIVMFGIIHAVNECYVWHYTCCQLLLCLALDMLSMIVMFGIRHVVNDCYVWHYACCQ